MKQTHLVHAEEEITGLEKIGTITEDGRIEFTGRELGLSFTETWTVLLSTPNTLLIKYCSTRNVDEQSTEGFKLFTKSGKVSVQDAFMIGGFNTIHFNEMCKLEPLAACPAEILQ